MGINTKHGPEGAAQPAVSYDVEHLPPQLRDLHRWVVWRYLTRSGKPTKVPYEPKTGREASTTDPQTWSSLAEAVHALGRGTTFSGPGFVFAPEVVESVIEGRFIRGCWS